MLLLQEFDLKIRDKKGIENQVVDLLSRLEGGNEVGTKEFPIDEYFLHEKLWHITTLQIQWYGDMAKFLISGVMPPKLSIQCKEETPT